MGLDFFRGFPNFFGRTSKKLATRIPYGHSIMTFVFWSPVFGRKNFPPMDFTFFWGFPNFLALPLVVLITAW